MKNLIKEDTATYRLAEVGANALTNRELIALIMGCDKTKDGLEKAGQIMQSVDHSISGLARLSVFELQNIGCSTIEATRIRAAFNLQQRKAEEMIKDKKKVGSSKDVFNMMDHLSDLDVEHFYSIYLDRANKVQVVHKISEGGVTGTIVDPRLIFKRAMEVKCSGIVLCHNHPSGNPQPSDADVSLTKKIKEGARLLDVQVLDHIIIAGNGYFSFADEGRMNG
jgi:DNA repair protein RadC